MGRRVIACCAVALLVGSTALAACGGDDDAAPKRSTSTSTSVAPPTTVDDARFRTDAEQAEGLITSAGADPCTLARNIGQVSALPAPANPTQAERGVQVIAALLTAMSRALPAGSEADGPVLAAAGPALLAEGAQRGWDPAWLSGGQGPAALTPQVQSALQNYVTNAAKQCGPASAPGR
ncbi:MAG: hypothetical protein ACOYOP_01995 [Microthrixaceae bacterium]